MNLANLITERCYLCSFNEQLLDAFIEYRNDLEWMKYQGFKGLTKEDYALALLRPASIYDGMQVAIICRVSDGLIGDIYLQQENDTCWIGYTISPKKARQGYALEVISALIQYLAKQGIKTIKAGVEIENVASVKLLKKLHFIFDTVVENEHIFKLKI